MEDLVQVLTKFHRDIVVPDIERIVGTAVDGAERRLRDEMQMGFDALAQRLDRLETNGWIGLSRSSTSWRFAPSCSS